MSDRFRHFNKVTNARSEIIQKKNTMNERFEYPKITALKISINCRNFYKNFDIKFTRSILRKHLR